jgi:DNA invertase Pin-like site-specific DNA recombinase
MADCRRRKIDVVLVWKFDRFARSLRQLVTALEEFRQLGIDFVSCTEAIDTSIPTGELVFQIFGAIAQFERVLIGERVRAGLANARREGKRLGRPPVKQLSPDQEAQLKADRARGKASLRTLAKKYGVSVWKVHMLCSDREVRV